jgi:S1-C subfamily serine protease
VNAEKARGSGRALFAKVAPAVVVVRTAVGHGTGLVISPQGRILTNHHVVESGSLLDVERGASWAHVHLGTASKTEGIQLRQEPVKAYLLAVDAVRDLALLEIEALPEGVRELPHLELARTLPAVGESCAIVGHPASGLLWTYRSGEVAAIGRSPDDLIEVVMPLLVAARDQRASIESQLARLPKRRIVLTSCGANSGDSGGPLVDENGAVIGVTFAIPRDAHARWSYHVHVDEVRAFLASAGRQPILLAPDGGRSASMWSWWTSSGPGGRRRSSRGVSGPSRCCSTSTATRPKSSFGPRTSTL